MFVYTETVEGGVGHSGDGQTSGIHGGSVLYEDHPHQEYQYSSRRQEYHDGTGGHHQSFPSEVPVWGPLTSFYEGPTICSKTQNWTMNMAPSIFFTALELTLQRER
ncbi:unnamed protein product [Linum trigynum]|uniref:Uncharacterized protein n=1 Tax=Linum trigynum TaxID=586398 RepID=A0AAV2CEX1_9ROSI